MLVWAFSSGPDPRSEGGPGGSALSCAQAGCHTGTALNAGGGKVELQFPDGLTYTPGQKQRIKVVITDSTARAYGYQVSARLASSETNGQAGRFDVVGTGQLILCQDGRERTGSGNCATGAPLEFIEHGRPATANTIEFDWTPPAAATAGNVRFYVAGNAANGDGRNSGDKIYTANFTLTPKTASSNAPAITPTGGVTNGASFASGVVSGSWTTIFGTNLAPATKDWTGAIDAAGNFPTSLDGVSVTIDGKPASIYFISPGQINVQAPDLAGKTGPVQVVVKTAEGESAPVSVTAAKELPGLFLFTQAPKKYPAAVRADGVFIGPAALFQGVTTVPAKPGDVVLFFGTGFGPTNPAVAPGKIFNGAAPLVDSVQMRIGSATVTPAFAGLSSSGLYQFNVTIPDVPNGEHAIEMQINSVSIQTGVVLAVQR
ncbi:MAG: IPT/TIG domain-containing protein [Bryobacterales bacterium]|nr:IPT/TIG domain-containing protein [Bryobacterales bacterium]